jgi:glucarate dehydratase
MEGSVRVAQMCHDFGYTWGSHSNNHFDISLAMMTHVGAAVPGFYNALDTHWIWQEGVERLTKEPLQIVDGAIEVRRNRVSASRSIWSRSARHISCMSTITSEPEMTQRSCRYLIPGWKFDAKRPCLVR